MTVGLAKMDTFIMPFLQRKNAIYNIPKGPCPEELVSLIPSK